VGSLNWPIGRPSNAGLSLETLPTLALLGCLLGSLVPLAGVGVLRWPVWLLAPGYVVLRATMPATLNTWTQRLFFSFAVSPAVIGFLLMVLTWWCGLSLPATSLALLVGLGTALIVAAWLDAGPIATSGTAGSAAPVLLLLLLFVPLQVLAFAAPIHRLSVHGVFHGAYIGQILAGLIPPSNPVLAEMPANNYWVYHLYLAAVSQTTGFSYIDASALLQIVLLIAYVGLVWEFLRGFFSPWLSTAVTIVAAFGANIEGPLVLGWRLLRRSHRGIPPDLGPYLAIIGHRLDPLLHAGIYVKFLTMNGFTYGLVFWAMLLYGCRTVEPWLVAFSMLGILLFHPTTGLAALTAVPAAYFLAMALESGGLRPGGRRLLMASRERGMVLAFALPVVAVAPYLARVGDAIKGGQLGIGLGTWALSNFAWLYLLLLPFAILGMWKTAWRDRSRAFVAALLIGMVTLALVAGLPWHNEYKFMYLTSIPLGLMAAWGLRLGARPATPGWRQAVVAVLVGLAYLNAAAVNLGWASLSWFDSRRVRGDGIAITVESQPEASAVMRWIRGHTPANAVVVEQVDYCERSLAGAVGHRQSLYVPCYLFTEGYPEAAERSRWIRVLFTPGTPKEDAVAQVVSTVGGPAFVVFTRERERAAYDALVAELTVTRGATAVLTTEHAAVFELKP
jgi:hypothetical protein